MKAAAFAEYGPTKVLELIDVADPEVGPRDVLIRVAACAVNHADLDSRAGTSRWDLPLPWVLGAEFAGTVVEVGAQVDSVRPGAPVTALMQYSCGQCARCTRWQPDLCPDLQILGTTRWGGYGELVSVPARTVVPLEPEDDLLAVAGGQCAVSTAWRMVNQLAAVRPGHLVLVPSASGGVANALVQCALLAGAEVVGTASSAAKAEQVASLGAQVVAYGQGDLAAMLLDQTRGRRFDAVLDTVGGQLFGTHLSVLRQDGTLVTCGSHAGEHVKVDVVELFQHGWRIVGFGAVAGHELEAALRLIRQGRVSVPIAATFPLADADAAHDLLERRQAFGKVLLVNS